MRELQKPEIKEKAAQRLSYRFHYNQKDFEGT